MKKIYSIVDPVSGAPVYIGQTIKSLNARLSNHLNSSKKCNSHFYKWVKNITSNNGRPGIILLEEVEESKSDFWEDFYIQLFNGWGFDLLNSKSGGTKNLKIIKAFDKNTNYFPEYCVEIIVLDTNNNILHEFSSIAECSKNLNIYRENIREVLVGKTNHGKGVIKNALSYKGYVFVYKDKYDPNKDYTVKRRQNNKGKANRIVEQYDLQGNLINTYISAILAAKAVNTHNSEISRMCSGKSKSKTVAGYVWKYKLL